MPLEKSAGAVIFRKEPRSRTSSLRGKKGIIKYLLLHYPSNAKAPKNYWDLPKGHIEKGEKEIDTAKREVEEETSLKDIKFVGNFQECIKYFFKFKEKTVFKIVTFYLAEAKTKKVKISGEHVGFKWLPFEEASKKLTFKNAREILKKADNFLKTNG
jgi:8-oxo-dGTP pyrophosphatase MutT (NUDIX family)